MHRRIFHSIPVYPLLPATVFWVACFSVLAEEPLPSQTPDTVQKLVQELDAPQFYVRESAMQKLRNRVSDSQDGAAAVAKLNELALDPQLSLEVHKRLTQVLGDAPEVATAPTDVLSPEQVQQLIGELGANRFALRDNAARRLRWVLRNDENVVPILLAVRAKLLDANLPPSARQELEQYYDLCRRAWLVAPADKSQLPDVKEEQIQQWVKVIAQPVDDEDTFAAQRMATRELEDVLSRNDYRGRAETFLRDQLMLTKDPVALVRLNDLIDFTRPAMVAEIWTADVAETNFNVAMPNPIDFTMRLATMQYLHIGVPQLPEGMPQATHFDFCDDKRAHCVSGNTLIPGNYPVRSAIPHPRGEPSFFYLVNLPTPRDRVVYEYTTRRGDAVRLREVSQHTCDAFLSKRRKFAEADTHLLQLLDQAVVAHFAGEFFAKIEDAPLGGLASTLPIGHTSIHGAVCCALARAGTKDAAPGIIKALEADRILPPDVGANYQVPWIALLAIAQRDPWDGVEDWLRKQLEHEDEPLVTNADPAPDFAATAAAILGGRLGQSPQSLGLLLVADGFCQHVGLSTYRFESAARRAAALNWFRTQSQEQARRKAS